jgi:hypothetical protein
VDILRGPNLKVERAEYHTNDLSQQIQTYLAKKPFRLMTRGEPKADREIHFIKEVIPIPPWISPILGDAIHNLRSALDLLMFAMIGGKATRPESVQFPFAKRADTLASTIQNREAQLAGEKVVAEIEALKPYPGGNEWLSGVHALDIADKHKLIIPAASSANMTSTEFSRMVPGITGREGVVMSIHQGAQFISSRTGPRAARLANRRNIRPGEYERDLQPTFDIIFDEGQPFSGRPIVPVLIVMVDEIRSALSRIARAAV